jgi:hypothetical protein
MSAAQLQSKHIKLRNPNTSNQTQISFNLEKHFAIHGYNIPIEALLVERIAYNLHNIYYLGLIIINSFTSTLLHKSCSIQLFRFSFL